MVPYGLEVHSNGVKIGYLLYATEAAITVLDIDSGAMFNMNDATGFLIGGGFNGRWTGDNCTGDRVAAVSFDSCGESEGGEVNRNVVHCDGGDELGATECDVVRVAFGTLESFATVSFGSDNTCNPAMSTVCGRRFAISSTIPTSFALPIEIVPSGSAD